MPLEETRLSHCADFASCQPSDSGIQYLQSENLKAVVIYTAVFFKTGLNIPVAAETTTVGDEGALVLPKLGPAGLPAATQEGVAPVPAQSAPLHLCVGVVLIVD